MQINHLIDQFRLLSSQQQRLVLTTFAFDLTIESRALWELPGQRAIAMAKALNEIQHKLLSQILTCDKSVIKYPPEVLFEILNEIASAAGIPHLVENLFARAMEQVGVHSP